MATSPRSGFFLWVPYFGRLGPAMKLPLILLAGIALLPVAGALSGAALAAVFLFVLLLLPLATVLYAYFATFLRANDVYTKVLILSYKSLFFGRRTPTAKHDMVVADLRPKASLALVPIAYALKISVPHGSEEEFSPATAPSFTNRLAVAFEENLSKLPYFRRVDRFGPGEDPVQYAMVRRRPRHADRHRPPPPATARVRSFYAPSRSRGEGASPRLRLGV